MEVRIRGKWYRSVVSSEEFQALVCAFLNGDGGNLSIGNGANVPTLLQKITPQAPVFFRKDDDGFYCVDVPPGNDKPYSVHGRFYVMRDGVAVAAGIEEIKEMLLASQVAPLRWERWFSDGIGIENFDEDELRSLFVDNERHSEQEIVEKLEGMGLSRQGRFTNATDVLLCKDVAARHPQIRAKAVAYVDKSNDIYRGYETFEGTLLKVFNSLYQFVIRHTEAGSRFSNSTPVRESLYQYPLMAIREGLINALVHRDYEAYSGMVKVEIQDRNLIIANTGGLYGGMTIERLKAGHLSTFRNPDMANYLNRRGFMEMTGRGSVLIQESCRKHGLPAPEWIADDSSVTLVFHALVGNTNQTEGDKGKEKNKEKGKEKSKEKSKEKLLSILSASPNATTADLVSATGLSTSGVEKNLRELKASGKLRRIGPDRGGHWEVVVKVES